jgi:ergothioneine biosynthesis protein EgtB
MNPIPTDREELRELFRRVRQASLTMCEPLAVEDFRAQPSEDVSPPWWNLGHTSWFFAQHVLREFGGEWLPLDRDLESVLNSYYLSLGTPLARALRGSLTRPTTQSILDYRTLVDHRIEKLISRVSETRFADLASAIMIGAQHEQQHQELFYTEIKVTLSRNPPPFRTPYRPAHTRPRDNDTIVLMTFFTLPEGVHEFGNVEGGWSFDNELPVHRQLVGKVSLQTRLVTNREYFEFMDAGGYKNPRYWLSNGWEAIQTLGWSAPLYWEFDGGRWFHWTLSGVEPLDWNEPVCHVSFYEADAFARWAARAKECPGLRLPTEYEWEVAARMHPEQAGENFLDSGHFHPQRCRRGATQLFGDVWEWTTSAYLPYPGFRPFPGALSEYNGKFMDNQRVLRGGSCVTERDHIRPSYRNFWPPQTRFQFTGFRLACDIT